MTVGEGVVWALLVLGTAAPLAAVVGVVLAEDVFARLHFIGPGSILGPVALALAVVVDEGPTSQAGLKAILVALTLLALSPVLVHATARAAYVREHGSLALPSVAEDGHE